MTEHRAAEEEDAKVSLALLSSSQGVLLLEQMKEVGFSPLPIMPSSELDEDFGILYR